VSVGGAVYENDHSLTLIDIGGLGSFSVGLSKHPEFGTRKPSSCSTQPTAHNNSPQNICSSCFVVVLVGIYVVDDIGA